MTATHITLILCAIRKGVRHEIHVQLDVEKLVHHPFWPAGSLLQREIQRADSKLAASIASTVKSK